MSNYVSRKDEVISPGCDLMAYDAFSSSMAGILSRLITHPLDTVRLTKCTFLICPMNGSPSLKTNAL